MTLDAQLRHNEKIVAAWNAANPVGTRVRVRLDGGRLMQSVTKSVAWVLGECSPVVMVEGISGCYSLNRIKPLPKGYRG